MKSIILPSIHQWLNVFFDSLQRKSFVGKKNGPIKTRTHEGFFHQSMFYSTPKAYLIKGKSILDGSQFYNFVFLDGYMISNKKYNTKIPSVDYLFSKNTSNIAFLKIDELQNPNLKNNFIKEGRTYNLHIEGQCSDSIIGKEIRFAKTSQSFYLDGLEYCAADQTKGKFFWTNAKENYIHLLGLNLDQQDPWMEVEYRYKNTNKELIKGRYSGPFEVISTSI
ncbi:MAG: hypothetical protein C4K58_05545 [Flavobacteriaceae bacterium]|nr:MAG: hypothetical protein C4K58_05545 [Flavobacteriaceae bacterium]